jgi:enamine deaminase RidA (YjgF/YER057c/UK114 family)
MSIERPVVAGSHRPTGYSHVVAAEGTQVFVAGQIAFDENGQLVGAGDYSAQTRQVMENVKRALAAAGAGFGDVVKLNTYVVGLTPEALGAIRSVRAEYLQADAPPASTLVGVTALAFEGLLIEVEAVAVLQ